MERKTKIIKETIQTVRKDNKTKRKKGVKKITKKGKTTTLRDRKDRQQNREKERKKLGKKGKTTRQSEEFRERVVVGKRCALW